MAKYIREIMIQEFKCYPDTDTLIASAKVSYLYPRRGWQAIKLDNWPLSIDFDKVTADANLLPIVRLTFATDLITLSQGDEGQFMEAYVGNRFHLHLCELTNRSNLVYITEI